MQHGAKIILRHILCSLNPIPVNNSPSLDFRQTAWRSGLLSASAHSPKCPPQGGRQPSGVANTHGPNVWLLPSLPERPRGGPLCSLLHPPRPRGAPSAVSRAAGVRPRPGPGPPGQDSQLCLPDSEGSSLGRRSGSSFHSASSEPFLLT